MLPVVLFCLFAASIKTQEHHLKEYFEIQTYLGNESNTGTILVYACAATLFLPVYITLVPVLFLFVWMLASKECRKAAKALPAFGFLLAFFALVLAVPAVYGNWLGVFTGAVFIVLMTAGLGFRVILKKWQYERALSLVGAGSVFGFLTALVQALANLGNSKFRPGSVTVNPNYYAALAALAALVCVYKIACGSPFKILYGVLLLMNLYGMELADCRSATAALLFSIVVFFLFNRQKKLLILSACLVGLFMAAILFFPELMGRFAHVTKDIGVRRSLWEAGAAGILQAPVFGKGTFAFIFNNNPTRVGFYPHSHNLVIEFVLNYGLAGAALFGVYAVRLLNPSRIGAEPAVRRHFALAAGVCAYTLAHGMLDCTLYWPSVLLTTLLLVSSARPGEGVPTLRAKKILSRFWKKPGSGQKIQG